MRAKKAKGEERSSISKSRRLCLRWRFQLERTRISEIKAFCLVEKLNILGKTTRKA